ELLMNKCSDTSRPQAVSTSHALRAGHLEFGCFIWVTPSLAGGSKPPATETKPSGLRDGAGLVSVARGLSLGLRRAGLRPCRLKSQSTYGECQGALKRPRRRCAGRRSRHRCTLLPPALRWCAPPVAAGGAAVTMGYAEDELGCEGNGCVRHAHRDSRRL